MNRFDFTNDEVIELMCALAAFRNELMRTSAPQTAVDKDRKRAEGLMLLLAKIEPTAQAIYEENCSAEAQQDLRGPI